MFGSEEQKRKWLEPLLRGEIRSCFCMTGISMTMSSCIAFKYVPHAEQRKHTIFSRDMSDESVRDVI